MFNTKLKYGDRIFTLEEFQPLSKKGKKFKERICSSHTFLNLHQEIFCKQPSFTFPPMTTTVVVSNEFSSLRNALMNTLKKDAALYVLCFPDSDFTSSGHF